jgi:hypothetical protein
MNTCYKLIAAIVLVVILATAYAPVVETYRDLDLHNYIWTNVVDGDIPDNITINNTSSVTTTGNISGLDVTEGGNAVYNSTETPGGELEGTWATPTLDDGVTVNNWALGTIASGVGTALTALNGENIQDGTIDDDSLDFGDITGADLTLTDCGAVTGSGDITTTGGKLITPQYVGHYGDADTFVNFYQADSFAFDAGGLRILSVAEGFGIGNLVVNSLAANVDFTVKGDTDVALFHCDAGLDKVGIGDSTPATKLQVNGVITADGGVVIGDANAPFVIEAEMIEGAEVTIYNANAPIAFRVIHCWAVGTDDVHTGSMKITDGTNDITEALGPDAKGTFHALSGTGALDPDYWDIAINGTLKATGYGKTPDGSMMIYIVCLPD